MKKSLGAQTLVYPTPVWVIGTYSADNQPNAMTAAWGGICCSQPPCVAVSVRKARQTYANIMEHRGFTVNIPSEAQMKAADYCGLVSGRTANKFTETGLTPKASELVHAPLIEEFPLVLECRLLHAFDLGAHTQFVGEILDVKAEDAVLGKNGSPDIEKIKPFLYATDAGMGYYGVGRFLGRTFSVGRDFKRK
jgi:flavin reductase (DIM6/NTAB) family NADH-FMN oxidoreductase RutF